jgi:general secretion pathway protein A
VSMLYLTYYGMTEKPFQDTANPKFLWLGESQAKALAVLKCGIQKNRSITLLTGDIGTGKTILINYFARLENSHYLIAKIEDPDLQPVDFFNSLSDSFGLERNLGDKDIFFSRLNMRGSQPKRMLIIIDEAHRIKGNLLKDIFLFLKTETEKEHVLNIILAGHDPSEGPTKGNDMDELKQKASFQCHLRALTENETGEYIKHHLKIAGADENLFLPDAMSEVYRFSAGIPRVINGICDHALMLGYSKDCEAIEGDLIKESAEDLQILN